MDENSQNITSNEKLDADSEKADTKSEEESDYIDITNLR